MRITITPVGLQSVRGFQGQAGSAGVNVNVMNVVYTFRKGLQIFALMKTELLQI